MPGMGLWDQDWLWRELASAARAPGGIERALRAAAELTPRTAVGRIAGRLAEAMAAGKTLAQAVKGEGDCFPPSAPLALEAAERNDCLQGTLVAMADAARAEGHAQDSLHRVVSWAAGTALTLGGVLLLISVMLLPPVQTWFHRTFDELDVELPIITKRMFQMPLCLQIESLALFIMPGIMLLVVYFGPARGQIGRVIGRLRMGLPWIGRVSRNVLLTGWCGRMEYLMRAGVDLATAARLAAEGADNPGFRESGLALALCLTSGASLSEALEERIVLEPGQPFPIRLHHLVTGLERETRTNEVWGVLGDTFSRDASNAVAHTMRTLTVIYVLLVLEFIGVIGLMALANFLPFVKCYCYLGG